MAFSLAAYLTIGLAACVLLSLVAYRLATDGGAAVANSNALIPVVVFLAVVAAGAVLGARSLLVQVTASIGLARRVRELTRPAPARLQRAAEASGLAGRVRLVDTDDVFSFTYGAITPRVAVSRGLVEGTSQGELEAVLAHEGYHVRNLDPLKVLLVRILPTAFFYLPALRDLRARYVAGRELAADRRAVDACGRLSLVGALHKAVGGGPRWAELGAGAAIGGSDLMEVRVTQLETGCEPRVAALTPRMALLSAAGAGSLAVAVGAAFAGLGGTSAVLESAMPGVELGPLELLAMSACTAPWLIGGWLGYRWLARRAACPLDTTRA